MSFFSKLVSDTINTASKVSTDAVKGVSALVSGKRVAVLGMKGAGKTQFYATLRQQPYTAYMPTGIQPYPQFEGKFDGGSFILLAGSDIGGGEVYVVSKYLEKIRQSDLVVFIFNARDYLTNPNYAREVRARIDFIWKELMAKYKQNDKAACAHAAVIASGLDLLPAPKAASASATIIASVQNKPYKKLFEGNFAVLNLRRADAPFKNFVLKIFK